MNKVIYFIVVACNTVWHLYFSESSYEYIGSVPVHGIRFCLLLVTFVLSCWRVVMMCKAKKTSKNTQGKYWVSYIRCNVMGNPVRQISCHYKSSLHHHTHSFTHSFRQFPVNYSHEPYSTQNEALHLNFVGQFLNWHFQLGSR